MPKKIWSDKRKVLILHSQEREKQLIQRKSILLISKTYDGAIAQLVEQRTENPCVPGSIPGGTTK